MLRKEKIQMIKVMQILTDTNIGGAGIWLLNFLKSYDREKYDVFVALPPKSALADRVSALNVPIVEIAGIEDCSFSLPAVRRIMNVIKKEKPKVVHTHASLSARIAAKLCNVPVVHTRHCLEDKKAFPKNIIYKLINSALSDHVIGVSKAVTDNLIQDGIKEDKLSLVYNGITPLRRYNEEERKKVRQEFGIPQNAVVVGIVARLEEVKNPLLFVKAAKIVAEKVPDVFFLIVGEGSLRQKVEAAARPIADKVHITGYLTDVERAYNAMDILTLTSIKEALSISLLEGQSIGLPVISTDSGGPAEIITPTANGILTPNGDETALADAIVHLIQNPEKRDIFGKIGKNMVINNFGSSAMADAIAKIYESLTGKDE